MPTVLYGLKNCDRCRKASQWLKAHGHAHVFHDLRNDGLDSSLLSGWADRLGWEPLLNRHSTTWRSLPEAERSGLDRERALTLMLSHPALIKRPLLVAGDRLLQGFSPELYAELP